MAANGGTAFVFAGVQEHGRLWRANCPSGPCLLKSSGTHNLEAPARKKVLLCPELTVMAAQNLSATVSLIEILAERNMRR